jgi:hypothetical protein
MCLRSIIGALRNAPSPALEVELCVPPLGVRARSLGSKFLLKKLAPPFSHDSIPALYLSIFRVWRNSAKSTPLLSTIIDYLWSFIPFIHSSSARLPLYDTSFDALLLNVSSIICPSFLGFPISSIRFPPSYLLLSIHYLTITSSPLS